MEILKGIGVSPGVAICAAVVLDAEDLLIPSRRVPAADAPAEVGRFDAAVESAAAEVRKLQADLTESHGKDIGGIFGFHLGLLRDKTLLKPIREEIATNHAAAEYAVSVVMRRLANTFGAMADKYLSERVKDVYDVEKRLLRTLIGQKHEDIAHLSRDVTVIAHDLLPSQTAALDKRHVKGFATDVGGRTSHTAIVARAMGLPAVVGLGNVTSIVSGGDLVIIDGTRGMVIVDPDAAQVAEHEEYLRRQVRFDQSLESLRDLPATTRDGHTVKLQANIEFPPEIDDAIGRGADGIGLYRTEFLFLAGGEDPSEDDHYAAYAEAAARVAGRPSSSARSTSGPTR